MKRTLIASIVLALLFAPVSRAQTRKPEPQLLSCIVTVVAIGILGCCIVACQWHAWHPDEYTGPTNAPPIVPLPPPASTNSVPTNKPPVITINASHTAQGLDVSRLAWTDSGGGQVQMLFRAQVNAASSAAGPYTNAYTLTVWQSQVGDTVLLEDTSGAVLTNYTPRAADGNCTNYLPGFTALEQQRFFHP